MNYGFLIRNDRCIGCHACSTACKSENRVPLGVNRTWVKSVETGVYPNVTRHFQVTRCNHCANPPCVRICPVTAMYQRSDGIVEFDPDECIGCKACLQACPYDAIYIDPESGTAAKCHYCAHRTDIGLEPACVVVCPEHAIIAGDIDNPDSEISQMLAHHQTSVRKPEQGTAPKLFYVDGADANLTPTAVERTPTTFAWADVLPLHPGHESGDGQPSPIPSSGSTRMSASGAALRAPQHQGAPASGPIVMGEGRMAEQMVQVAYNAQHKIPWHWPVPAYLVTKGIAAGIFIILSLGYILGQVTLEAPNTTMAGFVGLVFTAVTTALLVYDLEHPARFLRIILRPQWKSWLTRGAFILIGFSTVTAVWWVVEMSAEFGWWDGALGGTVSSSARTWFMWPTLVLAIGAAVYTAFLFGQAEGRDLWQSTLLPFHLIVQALVAGSGALLIVGAFVDWTADMVIALRVVFFFAIIIDVLVTFLGEFGMPHATEIAARAAKSISRGAYWKHFWIGSALVGHAIPLVLYFVDVFWALPVAGFFALVGLYLFEYAFVMAPQEIPNS